MPILHSKASCALGTYLGTRLRYQCTCQACQLRKKAKVFQSAVSSSVRCRRPCIHATASNLILTDLTGRAASSCTLPATLSLPLPPAYVPCPCPLSSSCSGPIPAPGPTRPCPSLSLHLSVCFLVHRLLLYLIPPSSQPSFPLPVLALSNPTSHRSINTISFYFTTSSPRLLHVRLPSVVLQQIVPNDCHHSSQYTPSIAILPKTVPRTLTSLLTRDFHSLRPRQHSNHRHRASTSHSSKTTTRACDPSRSRLQQLPLLLPIRFLRHHASLASQRYLAVSITTQLPRQ